MLWAIDPTHSQITFAVKHLGISTVRGSFGDISGTITETDNVISDVQVTIDTSTINTGTEKRDEHLRSADFFDVATYPTATFALTKAERSGEDLTATGDLTLHGVTKPVTLKGEIGGPAKDPWGNTKVSATLATTISRKEWGLTWNAALETGGVLVSDSVKLELEIQAAPAAAEA